VVIALVPAPFNKAPEVKLDAPVPPSATARSVMPVIEPPVTTIDQKSQMKLLIFLKEQRFALVQTLHNLV